MSVRRSILPNPQTAVGDSLGLKSFEVRGLFGRFNHRIEFPAIAQNADSPELVVLVGPNGVGKTTLLRMLAGSLEMDFTPFRTVPFDECAIGLTSEHELRVKRTEQRNLEVSFDDSSAVLHAEHSGSADEVGRAAVDRLRHKALPILGSIAFELVQINRGESSRLREPNEQPEYIVTDDRRVVIRGKLRHPRESTSQLADRIKRFMRDAQVDYSAYFASSSPNLIPRLVARLNERERRSVSQDMILERIGTVIRNEEALSRLRLASDKLELFQLDGLVRQTEARTSETMAVFEWYVEMLESRYEQRQLLASRLLRFEEIVNRFWSGKRIAVDAQDGLRIVTNGGVELYESQLSSGEYQLLFMMVTALVSSRSGTVIAIDEPELSLNVEWQRSLVKSLSECAQGAAPLLILATHSPTIAGEYRGQWKELK